MSEAPGEFRPAAPLRPILRTRQSAFSYECRACGRCCRDKRIPVNPYEVARLAAYLGIGTTAFIDGYTEGGTALKVREDVTCVFLDGHGCAVHADRPLVCRLYPLGLLTTPAGEAVVELEAQPGSEGVRGENGTVAAFLEAQGVAPFLDAARRYHGALDRLVAALTSACGPDGAAEALTGDAAAGVTAATATPDGDAAIADPEILDVDAALAVLARRGLAVPDTLDERVALHLACIEELAASSSL